MASETFQPQPPSHTPSGASGQHEKDHGITQDEHGHHHFHHQHITEYAHMPKHFHLPRQIHEDGESGRKGIHPWHFIRIIARSSCVPSAMVNILWPFVPAAIALYAVEDRIPHDYRVWVFILNYVAIIPAANLLGFAGQELARKLPKVFGILLETFLGGIVEIVLFTVLIVKSGSPGNPVLVTVIRDAIMGSILANLLFCMGLCFIAGGMRHVTQKFDGAITEVGCGLLFMAAFGLTVPRAFSFSLSLDPSVSEDTQRDLITHVSRIDAVILLLAFVLFVVFQMFSHHGLYTSIFEADELNDRDRGDDLAKDKLTLTECIIAIAIAVGLVSVHAVFLVEEIEVVIERGTSEMFLGLILVPLVEKFAEHLTAVDEAWDNTMNLALSHVLGATLQTALLNTPLVVLIGWGLNKEMNLDFAPFHVILLVLAVLAVGSFLRDQESNYLEGSLCVLIYLLIAASAYYYPNTKENEGDAGEGGTGTESGSGGVETGAGGETATESSEGAATTAAEALAHATGEIMSSIIEHAAATLAHRL